MAFRLPDWLGYEIQQRSEQLAAKLLAVRQWINAKPRIIIGITAISVFILLMIVIGQLIPDKAPKIEEYKKAWFYDLNTGKLFTAKSDAVPPVKAPSGPLPNGQPAGVKAYVFTYAYEPNESERFIGFLEIADPSFEKEKTAPAASNTGGTQRWGQGKLIRRVEDKQWVAGDSKQGRAILEEALLVNENGERPEYCPPD